MSKFFKKFVLALFVSCLLLMLWSYQAGYGNAIDWEVTTIGEAIEFPAWSLSTELITHEIKAQKYLLNERYSGSEIKRYLQIDIILLILIWIGLCTVLVASTYLKRYAFFVVLVLFALFLNRLSFPNVGLFGIHSKALVLFPFVLLVTPLVIFHEYKKSTKFLARIGILILLSIFMIFGVENPLLFTDHIIAHSVFGFTICALIFLFFIAEEIIFGILYVVTYGKGGKNNHLHFLILSLIYLGNLFLFYLNKSGLYENSFFFFDPLILFSISCIISLWSLKFKTSFLSEHANSDIAQLLIYGLGIITFCFLTQNLIRGNDAIYQAFHYFILYFHIGFGVFFFIYLIVNFIDPLIKGFQVFKISYRERNFPYVTARLGGLIIILAFYFLANQEPYNLIKSGYYNYLSQEAKTKENSLLAKEYALQASYIGYNSHMANYTLGWTEMRKQSKYAAKAYFQNATQRLPSAYAWVNYGNLETEINSNKIQAVYEEALRKKSSGEIENNLGIILLQKGELNSSINYFKNAVPSDTWNNAPLINKWNVFKKLKTIDSSLIMSDYQLGNYGVKANILTTQTKDIDLEFQFEEINVANQLHRQSYLLNSLYLFSHDSLESLTRKEIEKSSNRTFNNHLRKALAIHLYNKGKVNEAFMILNYLYVNAHEYYKGEYLDALGKFALDQHALQLSLEFFDKAIKAKHTESIFGYLEVLARMNKKVEITNKLLIALKKNPEFTNASNIFLTNLETFIPPLPKKIKLISLDSLSDNELIKIGHLNAFHEDLVISVAEELERRELSGSYELLVDALEINPYGTKILKKYILTALNWNLISYADQSLKQLKKLLSNNEYLEFKQLYLREITNLQNTDWE